MIRTNSREDFILKYRAALKVKLSRENLSEILNVKPDSIIRRRLAIFRETGLDLPVLESNPYEILDQEKLDKFNTELKNLTRNNTIRTHNPVDFKKKIFVITSAQNATPIHEGFFSCILNYCEKRNAQLLVIPNRYKNPTSVWTQNNEGDEWWDSKLTPYICSDDLRLTKSLRVMGHIKIQPTAERPLSGFDSYTGRDSAIFGHPKVQLRSIATPSQDMPKLLTTTGSVTVSNYTDSKAGWKGDFHHSISAVVVEIDKDSIFHIRHIHGDPVSGCFYDLDKYYTPNTVEHNSRIEALITGDTHAEFIDRGVTQATYFAKDSMVNTLNPKYIVFHDVLDFYAQNHHHRGNDVIRIGKHRYGGGNVEEGLQTVADFLDSVSREGTTNVIVRSNHDEAFDRWLREAEPKLDPENAQFYHYMKWHQFRHVRRTETGYDTFDAFAYWCEHPENKKGLKSLKNTKFLKRGESFKICDVELAFHGDMGANGARGATTAFSKITKSVVGHGHYPEILEGCYRVGTNSRLDLEYQKGQISNWMHTNCILYPDGKRTLVHIINGKWRGN